MRLSFMCTTKSALQAPDRHTDSAEQGTGQGHIRGETERTKKAANVERMDTRVSALETSVRRIDNHEQRLIVMERDLQGAAAVSRSMQETMRKLATDMAVVREILQRPEAQRAQQQ